MLFFPLQMVKMAPTNLVTVEVEVAEVAATMVAMAVKVQAVTLVAKQALLVPVTLAMASLPIPQTDNQLIKQAVLSIIILKEEQVDGQHLKAQ
jgi:hypothetical protein